MDLFDKKLPFTFPIGKKDFHINPRNELGVYYLEIPNGKLIYAEHFFDKKISDRSMDYFLENDTIDWQTADWHQFDSKKLEQVKFKNVVWRHDMIKIYGKEIFIPRFSSWYGDNDKHYTYSGLTLNPHPWNTGLLYIKSEIERISGTSFNSVLLNWYRSGEDNIGWHTDAEKELGRNPTIASVNFGETRRFLIRRKDEHSSKIEFPLKHGSLLIMSGELQHYWQHSVPKEKGVKHSRINLTFRMII